MELVESRQIWANDAGTMTRREWAPDRIGAHPPESLVQQLNAATMEVLAACGVAADLVSGGDGTSLRESYRRLLHSTIAPLGRILEAELRAKAHPGVGIGFDSLFAADLSGRVRAFQSMVGGGMDPAKAAALARFMNPNDRTTAPCENVSLSWGFSGERRRIFGKLVLQGPRRRCGSLWADPRNRESVARHGDSNGEGKPSGER